VLGLDHPACSGSTIESPGHWRFQEGRREGEIGFYRSGGRSMMTRGKPSTGRRRRFLRTWTRDRLALCESAPARQDIVRNVHSTKVAEDGISRIRVSSSARARPRTRGRRHWKSFGPTPTIRPPRNGRRPDRGLCCRPRGPRRRAQGGQKQPVKLKAAAEAARCQGIGRKGQAGCRRGRQGATPRRRRNADRDCRKLQRARRSGMRSTPAPQGAQEIDCATREWRWRAVGCPTDFSRQPRPGAFRDHHERHPAQSPRATRRSSGSGQR